MRVLLTGGMGFIGSHTAVSLLEAGHEPILYDNLSNADRSVVDRIGRITGHTPTFIEGDIRDGELLKQVLRNERIEAVIHFAGLKAVGESVGKPLEYFDNNVSGTIKLLEAMRSVASSSVPPPLFTELRSIFPSLRRSQPVKRPIHMVERKFTLKKSLLISAVLTLNGALYVCAISIPSGLTHQDSSVKIQMAFRTTCSPISPALRAADCLV